MKRLTLSISILLILATIIQAEENPGSMEIDSTKKFKLAIIQMAVKTGDRHANLKTAKERISEAAAQGAQVVLLPEAMDLGWASPTALTEAQPIPEGETSQLLISLANQHKIYICSGLIEKDGEQIYNSAILINPKGEIILKHRKINELDIAQPFYALGQNMRVCQTEYGSIGILICADANTPGFVLTKTLGYMGADVILSPSSWAVKASHNNNEEPYGQMWIDAYKPVAKDFSIWIASASNVGWMEDGPWQGWKGIGCSLVVDPEGEVALQGPYGEKADTVLYIDILPVKRPAQGVDWADKFWKNK